MSDADAEREGASAECAQTPSQQVDLDSSLYDIMIAVLESLEYADDAALVDENEAEASERVTRLEVGAMSDADMEISRPKTEVMHAQRQAAVSPARPSDFTNLAQGKAPVLKHRCQYCDWGFDTKQGLRKHITSHCEEAKRRVYETTEEEYEIEKVVDARGAPEHRFYLVRWLGWEGRVGDPAWADKWRPWRDMLNASGAVDEFWSTSGLNRESAIEKAGEIRCSWCNKIYKRAQDLKSHHTRKADKGGCKFKPKSRKGSRAEKAAIKCKRSKAQSEKVTVWLGDCKLSNVYAFKYLGFMFQADGDRRQAAIIRMGMAKARFGQLFHIWGSTVFQRDAKLQLFGSGVVSMLVYGCEAWVMDEALIKALKSWCARCTTHITGKSIKDEYKEPAYPLIDKILKRRFKWLGHSLRRSGSLVQKALLHLANDHLQNAKLGTILSEAPTHGARFNTVEELLELAEDRKEWNALSNCIVNI